MVLLSLATHPDSVVVHFNHGLRKNAALDASFVVQEAQQRQFICEVINLELNPNENMQDQARRLRYQHLVDVAKKHNISEVVLGHHGDDVVESMFLHLIRGTSIKGLQMRATFTLDGIQFSRPLLNMTKQQLREYAIKHNIAYVEDESNESDTYLRNRIRHHVIPLLLEEQPQLVDKFTQLSDQITSLIPLLDDLTDDVYTNPSRSKYQQLSPVLQRHVLSRWLEKNSISAHQALLDQMDHVLLSSTPHQEVHLSNEFQLQTSYDTVRFVTNVTSLDFMQKINAPGTYEGPNHVIVTITTDAQSLDELSVSISVSESSIFPLELRNRKAGDVVHLTGGRKKLKDWLIDMKIDANERNNLLVLAKGNNVLWIPRLNYTSSQSGQYQLYCSWRLQQ